MDGGGGQCRSLVEVMVGQYGCADVLMVTSTALLVVMYVVEVGLQVAVEAVRCADICGSRESRLDGGEVSCQDFWLAVNGKKALMADLSSQTDLKANKVSGCRYILKTRKCDLSLSSSPLSS